MRIQIINRTTNAEVARALPAIVQAALRGFSAAAMAHDLAPPAIAYDPLVMSPPPGWRGCYVRDRPTAEEQGVEGYHDIASDTPVAYVFDGFVPDGQMLRDPSGRGASLAAIITHELLEMWADEYANEYVRATFPDPSHHAILGWVAYELCDPVQESTIPITLDDGTVVDFSNYVYPAWFRNGGQGPFDALGLLSAPLTMAPGGYVIGARDGGPDRSVFAMMHHVQPQAEWRAQMKRVNARSRTRRRMS